ncbi:MAG TPA: hypothetical protein VGT44_00435 [Ktedonobacteraceae bacterium]|nr:hypothetical protein [Ktedonobacteraceae bacterium]
MILKDRLGLFALALVAVGIAFFLAPGGQLQGVGGIVFGTGLTVFLGRLTNRQQLAKEANLRRKTEVYEPLYIELQTLRKRLEEARAGTKPYLQQIDVPGQASLPQLEEPPRLHRWSEFKADSRYLEFSEAIRRMLDQTLELAKEYNASVEAALKDFEAILATYIETAINSTVHHPDFQRWRRSSPDVRSLSPDNAWFTQIHSVLELEQSKSPYHVVLLPEFIDPEFEPAYDKYITEVARAWATSWLRGWGAVEHKSRAPLDMAVPFPRQATPRPATLGWLLAGDCTQAALEVIRTADFLLSPPLPPIERLRDIMYDTWLALGKLEIYQEVRSRHRELFDQVSTVERKFKDKLEYIQTIYEGGPPLL